MRKAQAAHPGKSEVIRNSFNYLMPSKYLNPKTERLHHAHCAEMLGRIVRNQELAPVTNAEMICLFSATSCNGPLTEDLLAAFWFLFKQIFPDTKIATGWEPRESYEGRKMEIIHSLQRNYSSNRGGL